MEHIIRANTNCRLANWFFWVFSIENYDINNDVIVCNRPKHDYILQVFDKLGIKYRIEDSKIDFNKDYKQDFKYFNLDKLRKQLVIPDDIKNEIYSKIPDIEDRVLIHIRRGDYISQRFSKTFISLTENYIKNVYKKYYDGEKVIIISDDKQWCEENLKNMFEDCIISPFEDVLCDFFLQSVSKANICSGSSFSLMGTYLNKNENCVVPYPFTKKYESSIVPDFAKRENITDDMW